MHLPHSMSILQWTHEPSLMAIVYSSIHGHMTEAKPAGALRSDFPNWYCSPGAKAPWQEALGLWTLCFPPPGEADSLWERRRPVQG